MTNANIRYFATVARHGSIREAAEELNVAQSALSRQIQKLEEDLGVPLFQRHARGVELTSAGEIFLRHARSSLRQEERVRSELDALKGLRRGTVNLQAIESLVPGVLPQVIVGFSRRHPGITFNVTVDRSDRIMAAVREGRTDIGLVFYPTGESEVTSVFKMREPLVALMSPRHPLARKAKVSLAESIGYPIALPLKNSGSRMLIDIACKAAGIYMDPVLETNSIQLRVQFVHVNNGITFHSKLSAADSLTTGKVVAVPIRDRIVNTATIDVITHASRQLPLVADEFVRFLQGALQDLREPLSSAA
ncbi:LysR family transcriptional regulator [Reyranella sp.]|uniref:LysR family transcriptional regulator n=1 Tax=Reyranella sp. TaxID=1929291 RepID=UPI003BA91318